MNSSRILSLILCILVLLCFLFLIDIVDELGKVIGVLLADLLDFFLSTFFGLWHRQPPFMSYNKVMKLQDKTIVVVGGSQGIGKALAARFVKEGANVVVASRTKITLEKAATEIGGKSFVVDVRQEQDLRDLAAFTKKEFSKIDMWVNSAGLFMKFPTGDLLDMDRAHEMFDVNFFGAVLGSRTALLNMQDGVIINILSSAALDASRSVGAKLYAASKWALRGYVDALRGENKDNPVKILSIYPGGTKSHLHDEALPTDFDNFMEPEYLVDKIIANLEKDVPEADLIVKRPSVSS